MISSNNADDYMEFYYIKPYARIPPYVLGVGCGFIMFSYRKYKEDSQAYDKLALYLGIAYERFLVRAISSVFGLAIINFLIFIEYNSLQHPGNEGKYEYFSKTANVAYVAFQRFGFGLGITLLFLPMLLGHFRFITKVLSVYPWVVLSKFTFAIYLIHYNIIEIAFRSQENVLMLNDYNNIRDTTFFFFVSLTFAVFITLLVELPAANLEKLLFSSQKPKIPEEKSLIAEN